MAKKTAKKTKKSVKPLPRRKSRGSRGSRIKSKPVKLIRDQQGFEKTENKQVSEGVKKTKIRVIGIGGGGGSIVSSLSQRIKKASFVVANTDRQALKTLSHKTSRFLFGQNLTHGLGTGMNSEIAETAAKNEKEKIKKLLSGQDLCVIVACLGGGTGSGAAPIFAKIAKNSGSLTYGIFTLPFKFEGEKKEKIAREALEKLKFNLNALSVIPNERIFQIVEKNASLKTALSVINKKLAESLESLLETIYDPGLINIDFADLKTIFEGRGRLTYLDSVEISGAEKDEDLIKKVLHSPLYPYTMKGAKGVLLNIVGDNDLELLKVSKISKIISDSVNREAKIVLGISQKRLPKEKERNVKITILATGSSQRVFPQNETESKKKIIFKRKKRKEKIKKIKDSPKIKRKAKRTKAKIELKSRKKKIKETEKKEMLPKAWPAVPQKKEDKERIMTRLPVQNQIEVKVRRNGLEIKKDVEEEKKEIEAEERKWEIPAFLRKKTQ